MAEPNIVNVEKIKSKQVTLDIDQYYSIHYPIINETGSGKVIKLTGFRISKHHQNANSNWKISSNDSSLKNTTPKINYRLSDLSKKYSLLISKKILKNDLIKSFSLPKKIHGPMFTKSKKGMKYGRHIDNCYMTSGRADLSFTIFFQKKMNMKEENC